MPTAGDDARGGRATDRGHRRSRPTPSRSGEVLRHRDFDRMTPAELRDAERLVDLLVPAPRAASDASLRAASPRPAARAAGDVPAQPRDRRRLLSTGSGGGRGAASALVVLCDISRLDGAPLPAAAAVRPGAVGGHEVRTESFVFGTRLTRVTRLLRDRDRDRALARVADAVNDWAGGHAHRRVVPRVQPALGAPDAAHERRRHRRVDGWDRGDPAMVATETARLRRNCHRLIWLNPLAGARATSRSPAACGRRIRTSTTSCPQGPSPAWSASARSWAESGPATRGGGSEAAAHAAMPAPPARRTGTSARSPTVVGGEPIDPDRTEAAAMKELLEHARPAGRPMAPTSGGPSSCAPSAPRRGRRARSCSWPTTGGLAGSVSGGCVEGAASEEVERARGTGRPGDPLRHQRRAGMGRGPGLRRHHRRPHGAGRAGGGRRGGRAGRRRRARRGGRHAAARRLAAGRLRAARAGEGRRPTPPLVVHDDGTLEGTLGDAALDAELVAAALEALARGRSRTVELGGRSLFIEVFPVRPAAGHRGRRPGRQLARAPARELGYETVVIDGRATSRRRERFPDVDASSSAGPTRSRTRSASGRRCGRGADPRRQVRRAGDRRGARRGCRYVGAVGRARPRPTGASGCSTRG